MGIYSNTVSICQFQVRGELPGENFFDWAAERLAKNAFTPIERGSEEMSLGWVHLDDSKEFDFGCETVYRRDHYLVFSLRRDQRRVPAALLRAHMEVAERDYLAAHPGLQHVNKQKKEELREAVRGALLARTLPAPSVYDIVWDTRSNLLTLTSLSPKVIEFFETLFKQTFDTLRLVTVHPYARAERVADPALLPALHNANQAGSEAVLDLIRDNQWLGWDFLLWLMHQTMDGSSEYRVTQEGPAGIDEAYVAYLDERLVLLGGGETGVQKITVAGPQDNFSEVRTALQTGKQIAEANLYMEKQEYVWKLALKAGTFHFASFKCPAVKVERGAAGESEKEAAFYERMCVLEEGLQLFDSLLQIFLRLRLGDQWQRERQEIDAWLANA